ncbi:MAG: PDZ domain-containing protein [Gammaproteobacteria bacterium]|nr:PDZ domain-containing protein [Gammaproteobacteria bacterium]
MKRFISIITVALLLVVASGCTLPESAASTTSATAQVTTTTTATVGQYGLFDISPLVKNVEGGVVAVTQDQVLTDFYGNPQEVPVGAGTGVVIDDQGHILTNFHVVKGASKITVTSRDGKARPAKIVSEAPHRDLALLKVEDTTGLTPLPLGDSDTIEVGDPAIAIGNALALNASEPTVSLGIISALHRQIQTAQGLIEDAIQTDAAINPGNSGGPLLNAAGEVIGINTAIAGNAQSVGFAIPINSAKQALDRFQRGVGEPYLGVLITDNSPTAAKELHISVQDGALIAQVAAGSPADQAGLLKYDVIVKIGDTQITNKQDLVAAVNQMDPGMEVSIEYVRGSEHGTVTVTIGERPSKR